MAAVDPIFPKPTYFGKAKRWKLSDCQKYDAAIAGCHHLKSTKPMTGG